MTIQSSTVFTGDTSRIRAAFTDPGGNPIDADGNICNFVLYDENEKQISSSAATRLSIGVYYFDYTAPTVEGTYYVEINGLFGGLQQLTREKIKVKFKGP